MLMCQVLFRIVVIIAMRFLTASFLAGVRRPGTGRGSTAALCLSGEINATVLDNHIRGQIITWEEVEGIHACALEEQFLSFRA